MFSFLECDPSHFRCPDESKCIPHDKKCNGWGDCWDASDEHNCTGNFLHIFISCFLFFLDSLGPIVCCNRKKMFEVNFLFFV